MIDEDYKRYLLTLLVVFIFLCMGGVLYMFWIIYGCEYQKVQCFRAPCNPIRVCNIENFRDNVWNNTPNLEILEDMFDEIF